MLQNIRKNYQLSRLLESDAPISPFELFQSWLDHAIESELPEPTAMTLSTVDADGQPHSRIVLLKEFRTEGLTFFTNYNGAKALQIEQNNKVCLCFFWPELERQVRVEGKVQKISPELSDAYFKSRPVESRIGAWASAQSQIIDSPDVLDAQYALYKSRFGDDVPRPDHWGGYLVVPSLFEFWQGRPNRLHDRLCYVCETNEWSFHRLAP